MDYNIKERIDSIIRKMYCRCGSSDVKIPDLEPKTSLRYDLGFDSLDFVEMVMEFEKEFDVEIPDDTFPDYDITYGEILSKIEKILNIHES